MRVAFGEMFVPLDAYHTAHQVDHQVGVLPLLSQQGGQVTVCPVFGALAHDAGVQHDHIGLAGFLCGAVAHPLQRGGDALGIGHVHLASGRPDKVLGLLCHSRILYQTCQIT